MTVEPSVWLPVAVSGVVAGAGALFIWLSLDRGTNEDPQTWYAETQRLAAEIARVTRTDRIETIDRELLPLSSQLKRHAARAPSSVDDRIQRRSFQLGVRCESLVRGAGTRSESSNGLLPEERLSRVQELATTLETSARSNS